MICLALKLSVGQLQAHLFRAVLTEKVTPSAGDSVSGSHFKLWHPFTFRQHTTERFGGASYKVGVTRAAL
jgi:hypothetical protein